MTCLFLWAPFLTLAWQFSPSHAQAHAHIVNLDPELALRQLADQPQGNRYHRWYLQSLAETVIVLIQEDEEKFARFDKQQSQRLRSLEAEPESPESLFLMAELSLQRGFSLLNLNRQWDAIWSIRKANQYSQRCLQLYPDYQPALKTQGVIQVMVGSIPDKYQFFMTLLGLRGSVSQGQQMLHQLGQSTSSLAGEARILFHTIQGFINQEHETASNAFEEMVTGTAPARLLLFLDINMLMKCSRSEMALQRIRQLQANADFPMHYLAYLQGECLLQAGRFREAVPHYQKFIVHYKSQSFKKDAYYKIGLCYWLVGDEANANRFFTTARATGRETAEPDVHAARQLEYDRMPNRTLMEARLATDGGYYERARQLLTRIEPNDLANPRETTEFVYRQARLADKTGDRTTAKVLYQQTIQLTGQQPWYFGANAALQLGYIARAEGDKATAQRYFEQALAFKRHEYKNSIDTKARSALSQLKQKETG